MSENGDNPERKQYEVELHHDRFGPLGSGVLYFGGNRWAQVNLSISHSAPELRAGDAKFDLVKAITGEGTTFCLCNCEANGIAIFADYVIEGDLSKAEFDLISVRYHDVSEWFLRRRTVDGSVGETLTWRGIPKDIDVSVKTDEEHFDLRSEYFASRNQRGEDLILHEHVEFVFSAKNGQFSLADVKAKAHELSCLFSILLAYPATIASVMVSQGGGRFRRVHFPTFERPERDKGDRGFWAQWFVQQPALDGQWQSIFDHYYRSKYREICWVRLAGMQRYEGFWEYKALGYVSLLDSYLAIRFDGVKSPNSQPPSSKKINKFRLRLTSELPTISTEQRERIIEIASGAFASDNLNLEGKYRLAIATMDADVAKIINLSDAEFALIKNIRNRVAHGDEHGLEREQFPRVICAQSKIALLLTYWAFLDFGLTTQEFITCLASTHSQLKLASMIDRVHLDRVTGAAEFFPVTKERLQLLSGIKQLRTHGCCVEDENGDLTFSEELTQRYSDWMHDGTKPSGIHDPEQIFGVGKDQARFVGQAYFECEDERLSVHAIWIIKETSLVK
ncbi:hypothetical protein L0Z13_08740 [Burkholderia multivorans]|uniref:ApeA N-terminal domain 1-containing protein n=1 Tax=Burkholderia multivorans TaxID=87883 RepID=UPI000277D96A|nr:hypothetical protein [Burkholderia multivorans]AJY18722.1 hypothetical protein NP80_2152 [Burkholderia multivorans ATCC BAA-247]AVR23647.1 hypothetical protein A8H40_24565 [Burkholderia multivorans]EJO63357.1 hypothetical protein BURMUCF1_1989 [Burkholderia multivorans ATCC BAA-247]MBU9494159.1 hypothetical protein [Burkholderia multivorans]MCO1435931.1 hypothetical protein [Burkholderia multivorans]